MKKRIAMSLVLALLLGTLTGCAGTPVVYYTECNCPVDAHGTQNKEDVKTEADESTEQIKVEGAVKTGLAVVTGIGGSENAVAADYDVTIVAVTVDDAGVIEECIIDSVGTKVTFDAQGAVTADLEAEILTKNELGDAYGMKAYGGAAYEWYEQAEALAQYAEGKTLEELKNGAVDETGKAPAGTDLASTATIYLGGYVSAIEAAVGAAKHLGARAEDELKLAVINSIAGSKSAEAETAGTAQLDCDVIALTVKDDVITSCYIDAVQAKVQFDAEGTITTDLTAPVQTKNQLGENYGMVAWGGASYEWDQQAASFAAYVTGKTAAEVAGIAVTEGKPSEADLASSVTIAIGGFQALVAKALQ